MDASVYQDPRKRMIPLADGEMAALEFGDPQRPVDVVFSHANGFNALTYRTILAPLAASLRVLAIDLRGHGASRLPTQPVNRTSWRDFPTIFSKCFPISTDRRWCCRAIRWAGLCR